MNKNQCRRPSQGVSLVLLPMLHLLHFLRLSTIYIYIYMFYRNKKKLYVHISVRGGVGWLSDLHTSDDGDNKD